jgi:hypothetical protein
MRDVRYWFVYSWYQDHSWYKFNDHCLIGFLAVSYVDGSLIVVDMRGPKIILFHEAVNKKNKHKLQHSIHARTGGDGPSPPSSAPDIAKSLTWTISRLDKGKLSSCHIIMLTY